MLTSFDDLSPQARVWIYQADRKFSTSEQRDIIDHLEPFLIQWTAHGQELYAAGTILYDHFLIIALDESLNRASGCSIDRSVRFVQELGGRLQVDFFKRTTLAFLLNEEVRLVAMDQLKAAVDSGEIQAGSLFFENTIRQKGQLENSWIVKADESWLKRYFKASLNV